jgi:ABC-type phosphate/phosphonate transport system substrate-binding protein
MSALELMVCPHDTAKEPDRWFRFAQYLSQRLGTPVNFSVALDFDEFHQRMAYTDILANLLTTMTMDPRGIDVLQALHIEGWDEVAPGDLAPIRALAAQPVTV